MNDDIALELAQKEIRRLRLVVRELSAEVSEKDYEIARLKAMLVRNAAFEIVEARA